MAASFLFLRWNQEPLLFVSLPNTRVLHPFWLGSAYIWLTFVVSFTSQDDVCLLCAFGCMYFWLDFNEVSRSDWTACLILVHSTHREFWWRNRKLHLKMSAIIENVAWLVMSLSMRCAFLVWCCVAMLTTTQRHLAGCFVCFVAPDFSSAVF